MYKCFRPVFRQIRANLTRYGTPIVLNGRSLDRTLDEIAASVTVRLPS